MSIFGKDHLNYRKITDTLKAGETKTYPMVGDFFDIVYVSTQLSDLDIKFYIDNIEQEWFNATEILPANTPFSKVAIKNVGSNTLTFYAIVGREFFKTSRQSVTIVKDLSGILTELIRESKLGILPVNGSFPELSGTWSFIVDRNCLTGVFWRSNTTDSYLQLKFRGRKIGIIFIKGSNRGIAGISIDGGAEELYDLYSPIVLEDVWYKDGLSDTEHTIKIRVTGTKNPNSANYYVYVEGFLLEQEKNIWFYFDRWNREKLENIRVYAYNLWDYVFNPISSQLIGADLTVAQSISLDTYGRKILEVYAKSTASTTFYLDVSPDNSYWISGYKVYSAVTEVKDTLWNGFRYVRLRSDAAGVTGDTVDLVLAAKS